MAEDAPAGPKGSRLTEMVGPFYDRPGILGWLGLTETELAERVRAGSIIECVTSDGVAVYPSFQFEDDGTLVSGIDEVLPCFVELGLGGWAVSKWLVCPHPDLPHGSDAMSLLRSGEHRSAVVQAARRDMARLAH